MKTMGRVFTAGDSTEALVPFMEKWTKEQEGVGVILDYAKEAVPGEKITKEKLDLIQSVFEDCMSISGQYSSSAGNQLAVKVTGVASIDLLKKFTKAQHRIYNVFSEGYGDLNQTLTAGEIARTLRKKHNVEFTDEEFYDFLRVFLELGAVDESYHITKLEWLMYMHPYYVAQNEKNSNKILQQISQFDESEISTLRDLSDRLLSISDTAQKNKVTLLIDAEQTYIQGAIDSVAMQLSDVYNTEEAMILNTFQGYLKNSTERVHFEIERCKALDIKIGAKFVRGAYMVEERQLAKENGYADPIHDTLDDTHDAYNLNVERTLLSMNKGSQVMIASHNEESVQKACEFINNYDIKGKVTFAQLLGLADHLTASLVQKNQAVSKYVPFGPLNTMIPYLIRRAQESKQMLGSARLQRDLILDELKKRTSFKSN